MRSTTPTTAALPRHEPARADTPPATVSLDPASTYEVVTRQMVDDLIREVTAIRQRVDSIFYLVIAAIVGNVVLRLL